MNFEEFDQNGCKNICCVDNCSVQAYMHPIYQWKCAICKKLFHIGLINFQIYSVIM